VFELDGRRLNHCRRLATTGWSDAGLPRGIVRSDTQGVVHAPGRRSRSRQRSGQNRGMRPDGPGGRSESGVGHLLVVAVVLVLAIVAIVALSDQVRTSTPKRTGSRSSSPLPSGATRAIDAEAVARTVRPAVVDLQVSLGGGGHTSAAGMVVTPAGEVVTDNQSIAQATSIAARVPSTGRTYAATVVGYDATQDVAVLALAGASGLATIEPADTSALVDGEPVLAVGSVASLKGAPIPLSGTVTALHQRVQAGVETLEDVAEIDVASPASDTGGPIADAGGKVVAMTAAAAGAGHLQGRPSKDVMFAIPIGGVLAVVDRIDADENSSGVHVGPTAVLGIAVRSTSPDGGAGAYVVSVQRDGPAARAGIATNTIVVSINETTIPTPDVLQETLDRYRPGDVVRVGWIGRDGLYRSQDVRLGLGSPA
jgi:S1-C subfamily serine protease